MLDIIAFLLYSLLVCMVIGVVGMMAAMVLCHLTLLRDDKNSEDECEER